MHNIISITLEGVREKNQKKESKLLTEFAAGRMTGNSVLSVSSNFSEANNYYFYNQVQRLKHSLSITAEVQRS